jgi:hypothetical protein
MKKIKDYYKNMKFSKDIEKIRTMDIFHFHESENPCNNKLININSIKKSAKK